MLILSADVGSGHLVSARALASELEQRGVTVAVEEDLRSSLGWLPRLVIRDGSRVLFAHAPRLYDLYYRLLLRCPRRPRHGRGLAEALRRPPAAPPRQAPRARRRRLHPARRDGRPSGSCGAGAG